MDMLHLEDTVHLDQHETVVSVFRSHPFRMVSRVVPLIFILMVLFLFVFPLFSFGMVGISLFVFLLFVGVLFLCRNIFNWLGTYCVLTDTRLLCIQRTGFFKKQVQEIVLENITELSYATKGMMQTIFHFGNVRLALRTTRGEFIIPEISKPQMVLDLLSRQASAVRKRSISQAPQKDVSSIVTPVYPVEKQIHDL